MRRSLLIALNLLLIAAIVGVIFFWHPAPDQTPMPGTQAARMVADVALAAPPAGGDFSLDGPRGRVSLHDYAGKLVLLQFGYTYCPDICPTSLTIVAQALGLLTPVERHQLQVLFVSVDPERDTVARLVEYTTFFDPLILGLTGAPGELAGIATRYGAIFSRQENASAGGYVIDHTALTYLIDARGKLVTTLPHATPAELLAGEIRKHLPKP